MMYSLHYQMAPLLDGAMLKYLRMAATVSLTAMSMTVAPRYMFLPGTMGIMRWDHLLEIRRPPRMRRWRG